MLSVLVAAVLMAAAEPSASAAADAAVAAVPAQTVAAKADKPKGSDRVCWDERPTGSHVSKHYCARRDDLEKMQHDAQDAVASRARANPPGGFGPAH